MKSVVLVGLRRTPSKEKGKGGQCPPYLSDFRLWSDIFQKSLRKLADRRSRPFTIFDLRFSICLLLPEKGSRMFGKLKKRRLLSRRPPLLRPGSGQVCGNPPQLFTIRWYPSTRSCLSIGSRKPRPQQMPPLMVRKPEWRR